MYTWSCRLCYGLQLQENIFRDLFPKTLRGRKVWIKNNPGMLLSKSCKRLVSWNNANFRWYNVLRKHLTWPKLPCLSSISSAPHCFKQHAPHISAVLFSSDAFRSKSFCSCTATGTLKIRVFQFSMFIQENPFKKMEAVHRWCWSVLRVCGFHRYFCNLGSSWESRWVFVILGVSRPSIRARGRSDKKLSRNRPNVQKTATWSN